MAIKVEHLHPFSAFQDGNVSHYNSIPRSERLVCHPWPLGYLLSCSHPSILQMFSMIQNRFRILLVLRPSLWALFGAQGLYKVSLSSGSSFMLMGHISIPKIRWLAPQGSISYRGLACNIQGYSLWAYFSLWAFTSAKKSLYWRQSRE